MTSHEAPISPLKSALAMSIAVVESRIWQACDRAGRQRDSVRLIAVSKRHPVEAIQAAFELGLSDFGENYVQELVDKCDRLGACDGLRFHAIGHLQRNKVRSLVQVASSACELTLHAVDNQPLIAELQKRALAAAVQLQVLVEVNVAREPQKAGCLPQQLPELLDAFEGKSNLSLQGLMAIPPSSDDPETARPHFALLRELSARHCPFAPRLSMGMSHDFEVAIEEGATDIRVGSAIFGERNASVES